MKSLYTVLVAFASTVVLASNNAAVRTCAMERLAPGSVCPQGWLLKQMGEAEGQTRLVVRQDKLGRTY